MEQVVSYTADRAVTAGGAVYGPFAEGWELSETADCAGILRADWRAEHSSQEQRIEDLEPILTDYPKLAEAEKAQVRATLAA